MGGLPGVPARFDARLRTRARVAAHVLWDTFTNPAARVVDDVPWSAEALTASWLTAVLCGGAPGAEVIAFRASAAGAGSSVRYRLGVTYNEDGAAAGLPERLYVKSTPTLLTRLTSGIAASVEANFFRCVRPHLRVEAPVHHHSAVDGVTLRSMHLFEDLERTKQAEFCGPQTVVDRDAARQLVDTLVEVHGPFLGRVDREPALAWVPEHETFFRVNGRNGFPEGHARALAEVGDNVPGGVAERWRTIWPKLLQFLAAHAAGPRTLLHSDVHLGNWYVTGTGRWGLCDWATVCTGHWSRDVAYALSTCLTVEDRRAWEHELLDHYLGRMADEYGLRISAAEAWLRYRQQLLAALLMWTPTLCHPPTMPDMQPREMSLEMIRRITAAIADHGVLDEEDPR